MGVAAAIIGGVAALAAGITSGVSAASEARDEEELYEQQKAERKEQFAFDKEMKERQQGLAGLDALAASRDRAIGMTRRRNFSRDMSKALSRQSPMGTSTVGGM